jgi:hypothetical protein
MQFTVDLVRSALMFKNFRAGRDEELRLLCIFFNCSQRDSYSDIRHS